MTSSASLQKRIAKAFSKGISSFDLFYQLTYMSATAAAGIGRDRVFRLARELPNPAARHFRAIHELVEDLRLNYPDACRAVGEQVDSENTKYFLFRLSDSLRSGEPLALFLAQEAEIQGENYANEYERKLESLKKWNDGYTSITVSVALIVIINMVSSMIYDIGTATMMIMVMTAAAAGFGVAWVLGRAAPQEVKSVSLAKGSKEQRLARKLFRILVPVTVMACLVLVLLKVDGGWIMILASLPLFPIGVASLIAENKVDKKDAEVSAFLRSIGGTATSRGTTLQDALDHIQIDSFPTLELDIQRLGWRLKAFVKPPLCWQTFGTETGSTLVEQAIGVFFEAVNLGGDPEEAGLLSSLFSIKTTMLRAKRRGAAATFTSLVVIMHGILTALMGFLLGIIHQFVAALESAMAALEGGESAGQALPLDTLAFSMPDVSFLDQLTMGMVFLLALINAFAAVSSEGAHMLKMFFYLSILLLLSGVGILFAPSLAKLVM